MKFLLLFLFQISLAQSYIIGDSQSFYIAKHSLKAKILKPLAKSGIGVIQLLQMAKKYPIDTEAVNIFISIGVNDGYEDKGISSLIKELHHKFPNAELIVVRGSYGWGNLQGLTPKKFHSYYNIFKKYGLFVFSSNIGAGDPHRDKEEYFNIAVVIDCIIYHKEGYKCIT